MLNLQNLILALVCGAVCFGADQASKWWVVEVMDLPRLGRIEVAPLLNFAYARNTGVNFGLFASGAETQQTILATFATLVSLALMVWAARTRMRLVAVACGVVAGGALANALDRVAHGAVIDFLNVDCCGIGNPYAFNIADVAIFAGAGLLLYATWGDDAPEKS